MNQVSLQLYYVLVIGWSYDAAGNLLSNGTHTSNYDPLSRQVSRGAWPCFLSTDLAEQLAT